MTRTTASRITDRTSPIAWVLQAEALAFGAAAITAFAATGGSWLMFAVLILVPDLFMLGYLRGPRVGAFCYNLGHSTLGPLTLSALWWANGALILLHLALIWAAHIGLDRAIGYGLKYACGFKQTHLARV